MAKTKLGGRLGGLFIIGALAAAAYFLLRVAKGEAAPAPTPPQSDMVLMRNRITGQTSWIFAKDVPLYQYPAGDWDSV